jgi:alpha-L-fucosidase
MRQYGETIYGTRGGPYKPGIWGGSTRKGNKVYLHVLQRWPHGELLLPALPQQVVSHKVLTGGEAAIEQTDEGLSIKLDPSDIQPLDTIIELTLAGDSIAISPIETMPGKSLTFDAEATASSTGNAKMNPAESVVGHSWERKGVFQAAYGEEGKTKGKAGVGKTLEHLKTMAKRELDNRRRFWEADAKDKEPWLQIDMGKPKTFDRIRLRENAGTTRAFIVEYKKDGRWIPLHEGKGLELFNLQLPAAVTTQVVRIRFTEFTEAPGIHTFHVYAPDNH